MEQMTSDFIELTKIAAGKRIERPLPDLSKKEKSITYRLFRDKDKFDEISKPAFKFKIKRGQPEFNAALDAFIDQLEETLTDGGKEEMTPAGTRIMETANKLADKQDFTNLHMYVYNIGLKGSGMPVITELAGIEKNSEKLIQEIIAEKTNKQSRERIPSNAPPEVRQVAEEATKSALQAAEDAIKEDGETGTKADETRKFWEERAWVSEATKGTYGYPGAWSISDNYDRGMYLYFFPETKEWKYRSGPWDEEMKPIKGGLQEALANAKLMYHG